MGREEASQSGRHPNVGLTRVSHVGDIIQSNNGRTRLTQKINRK